MMIAIDGPAASGKGTLARRLAARYGLRYLDTGLTYRAVAAKLLDGGRDLSDTRRAVEAAEGIDLDRLDRGRLASQKIGQAASRIAVMAPVREALVRRQRAFALAPPGAVLDGRDIGTVVLPDADVKLFVAADPATRATRRVAEIRARGGSDDFAAVLADLMRRDARDAGRTVAPLAKAPDARELDTTSIDAEEALQAALGVVEAIRSARRTGTSGRAGVA